MFIFVKLWLCAAPATESSVFWARPLLETSLKTNIPIEEVVLHRHTEHTGLSFVLGLVNTPVCTAPCQRGTGKGITHLGSPMSFARHFHSQNDKKESLCKTHVARISRFITFCKSLDSISGLMFYEYELDIWLWLWGEQIMQIQTKG